MNLYVKSQQPLMVIGHRNPDTDAITAAIVYADLLNQMNIKAKPYRLGDLNNETKFILKTAGIQPPDMLPDDVPEGCDVALVDHNESMKNNFDRMKVQKKTRHFAYFRCTIDEKCEKNACYSCN